MIIIDFGALELQHSVQPQQLGLKMACSTNGVSTVTICPSLIQVHHPLFNLFVQLQLFSVRQRLFQGHMCRRRGGFSWKTPNHSLGTQISVYLQNPGTILIIGIILQYPLIIRFGLAHLEQFSTVSGSGGREQLNIQINSLACLETSELPHVLGILSGTGRLPLLQSLTCIQTLPSLKTSPLAD